MLSSFFNLFIQFLRKHVDNYWTGKEIPKVEFLVTSTYSHGPLVHTITFTGVEPPHNFIVIQRPFTEPAEQRELYPGEFYAIAIVSAAI